MFTTLRRGRCLRAGLLFALFSTLLTLAAPLRAADGEDIQSVKLRDGPSLLLNGLAAMHDASGDIFIGGFYLEHRYRDADSIAEATRAKRIAIRMVADRFSGRRFGQMWRDRIAINNTPEQLKDMGPEIKQFLGAFSGTLRKGDRINIDFLPASGSRISINGVEVAWIKKPAFIEPVIRAWVGERPPSVSFKQGVLGLADGNAVVELQSRFAALKPDPKRAAEIRSQRTPPDEGAVASN